MNRVSERTNFEISLLGANHGGTIMGSMCVPVCPKKLWICHCLSSIYKLKALQLLQHQIPFCRCIYICTFSLSYTKFFSLFARRVNFFLNINFLKDIINSLLHENVCKEGLYIIWFSQFLHKSGKVGAFLIVHSFLARCLRCFPIIFDVLYI